MADPSSRGFRKFMLDPKSSVMTYIADNIPPDHLSHQQGSNSRLHNGPMNGQRPNVQDPNQLQQNYNLTQNPQNQSQDGLMRPPLPTRPSQSNSPSSSPRPGYAQPAQSSQMPMNTPYIASNISQSNQELSGYAGAQYQLPGPQSMSNPSMAQETMSQQGPQSQYPSIQNSSSSTAPLIQGPPQPGARRRNSPQSAPRLYHRMLLEFEITKKAFFVAKSQYNTQEMTTTAYELESSSRRIWGLRYEHSWEFEGYSDAGHQAVFSKWQAEYEMWADTVLEIQDGQILADAAGPSKYGRNTNTSTHRGAEEWDSQMRPTRSGYQEPNDEPRHHSPSITAQEQQQPPPQPPTPQFSTLSLPQPPPPAQTTQNIHPPQSIPPVSYPQTGQTPQTPPPPPIPTYQSPHPPQPAAATTNRPPSTTQPSPYNSLPTVQNIPIAIPAHQPQPTMRPAQPPQNSNANPNANPNRPPGQQYAPQNQAGMPSGPMPNLQPNMGASQQGPPAVRNGMPQGVRQNASPRAGPVQQVPVGLQAGGGWGGGGGQMGGNGGGRA